MTMIDTVPGILSTSVKRRGQESLSPSRPGPIFF